MTVHLQLMTFPALAPRLRSPGYMRGSPLTMNGASTGTVWPSADRWSQGLWPWGRRTRASRDVSHRFLVKPASTSAVVAALLAAEL